MALITRVELKLDSELLKALRLSGLEILWTPGNATISSDFKFTAPCSAKWMQIKSGVELGAYSYAVSGYYQRVSIGRYTSIGEDVQFGRGDHSRIPISNSPIFSLHEPMFVNNGSWRSSRLPEDVLPSSDLPSTVVGNDVWIGHGSFIKPGVVIGDGAIIGAASVVTRDVAPFSIVGGNPARVIRMRYPADVVERLLQTRWWVYNIEELDGINFGDMSMVLDRIPQNSSTGKKNLKRSVNEFVFTREDMDELHSSPLQMLKHHSGFEYSVIKSPNRFQADSNFHKNPRLALDYYLKSVQVREEGQVYTLLNGALCAFTQGEQATGEEWVTEAINHHNQDQDFFDAIFPEALWRVLTKKTKDDAAQFLEKIAGHIPLLSKENLRVVVIGFPRCGTTTIYKLVSEAEGLQTGLVAENFPPDLGHDKLESLFDSYDLYLHLGSALSQKPLKKIIDKSTMFCMSKELLLALASRYPSARLIVSTRNPFDRALSAYKMTEARFTKSLLECVEIESDLIKSLGGARVIFNSLDKFRSFHDNLKKSGINYSIVLASIIMINFLDLLPESLRIRLEFITLSDSGLLTADGSVSYEDARTRLNSSETLTRDLSKDDKEALRKALVDSDLI